MRPAVALIASLLLAAGCRSSRAPETLDQLLEHAVATMRGGEPRAAEPLLERALAEARSAHSVRHEALALGHLGSCYKNLAEYEKALRFHRQALALKESLGDEVEIAKTLSNIGLVQEALGDCRSAIAQYDRSIAILARLKASRIEATVINNRALCLDNLGEYARAAAEYERSLAMHRAAGNDVGAAQALGNLGGVCLLQGRYTEAERYYREALAIDERQGARQAIVLDLVNLGQAAAGLGRAGDAIDQLAKARRMAAAAGLAREAADADRARAEVLATLGRYEDARDALATAATAYERAGLAREQGEARIVAGRVSLALGDVGAADASFSIARAAALHSDLPALVAAATLGGGDIELRRQRPEAAASRYLDAEQRANALGDYSLAGEAAGRRSAASLASGQAEAAAEAARTGIAVARRGAAQLVEGDAQISLGRALLAVGKAADARDAFQAAATLGAQTGVTDIQWRAAAGQAASLEALRRNDEALASYLRAVSIIESVRERLHGSRDRAGYLDDKRQVYAALVRLLLRLGRTDEAFRVAERLRSAAYLDLLARSALLVQRSDAVRPSGVLLARLAHLQQRVGARGGSDVQVRRADDLDSLRAELRAAETDWTDALDLLARHDPVAAALKRQPSVGTRDVQRRVGTSRALIQYVTSDRDTMIFVITASAVHTRTVPIGAAALKTRVELLRGLVRNPATDDWLRPAARLYADLIAPIARTGWLRGVTTLLIVPHAELNYLPFALLAREPRPNTRLLVDDFSIGVLPSASALVVERPRPGAAREGLLAVAPEPSKLPYSKAEVSLVGALFPVRPRVLVGALATERAFKEQAPGYAVLHLATHGAFNAANPLLSGLDLAPDDANDGRLRVFEILGLDLHASLVTLSACDTALASGELSDVPAGEEFIGLTRAFLSAGSRNVLASLWEVNDRATPALMESFYEEARRSGVLQALASAQRQRWHSSSSEHHPFFWGGFVAVGTGTEMRVAQIAQAGP